MSSAISPRSGRPEAGLDRRSVVTGAAAGLAIAAFPGAAAAQTGLAAAEPSPELAQLIARVTEGAVPERARITLDIPALVENGNSVDTRISVESAMTDAEHVRWIHLIAEKNPFPDMARFHLGPRAGRAEVSTTLRFAQSQKVTVVAALSSGRFVMTDADIVVTLSACIDGG